ncbi:hypothetical protein Scep_006752 [Stephania cephalantha]|uniref:Pectinesterase inhibitor domain-containing protein n=1 Tax=Stephania cephalantha TaxID=152367 RepID=A0AAP0K9S5_9MAGN
MSFSSTLASTILLVLLFFSSASSRPISTNTEFIRHSCVTTTYPTLCIISLSTHATAIQTSPKLLAHAALSVTLTSARTTSAAMSALLLNHKGLRPREVAAMRDCVETMGDSVDELRRSIGEMGHLRSSNIAMQMSDIETWVSAALTEEDTCMDGFAEEGLDGPLKSVVRRRIVNVAHLTSNALALVNHLASLQHAFP